MPSAENAASDEQTLLDWYASQRSLRVDIVGDFAGHEHFIVHGESLIRYCLAESKVDFQNGFQLLHSVYAVESFLENLRKRGCNFDIVFFQDLERTCVPTGTKEEDVYKYLLARTILIRHLNKFAKGTPVQSFDGFDSSDFHQYLTLFAAHFVLCHDGDDNEGAGAVQLRHLIWRLITRGINVAIINTIEWKSSKVFVPVISGAKDIKQPLFIDNISSGYPSSFVSKIIDKVRPAPRRGSCRLTSSFSLTTAICRAILDVKSAAIKPKKFNKTGIRPIQALLLHTATIWQVGLRERILMSGTDGTRCLSSNYTQFLSDFSETAKFLVHRERDNQNEYVPWNYFDLIDGRLFFAIAFQLERGTSFPQSIASVAMDLWRAIAESHHDRLPEDYLDIPMSAGSKFPIRQDAELPAILPFNHPVLDEHLKAVKVKEAKEAVDPAAAVVFEDLYHWHCNKPVATWKKPAKPGFYARRGHQTRMKDIIRYAASLTDSRGKILDRETIIVGAQAAQAVSSESKKASQRGPKKKPGKRGPPKKGGLASALKTAQDIREGKAQEKRQDLIKNWSDICTSFEKDPSLVGRFLKVEKWSNSRTKEAFSTLKSDIGIYRCYILAKIWVQCREERGETAQGSYLVAMLWRWLQDVANSATCTPDIDQAVQQLATVFRLPTLKIVTGLPPRALPFRMDLREVSQAGLVGDSRILQLEHGGPYMDRRFDSQPDPRVPFQPDAWQRKVLDSIDKNESLLVVAPTSAGKTFISFYAMKKVLEESDDGVLVYVAPTKALVNQIAAEIEARFSKSFNSAAGRSIWAVHTRDYRINSPAGCQILVTVPHILQIMLLSPKNADHPKAWSRRVRRIIFDEVHCIGQAEDGVIWEQLLLLAPCPIVALSATVGNPGEFLEWLKRSQQGKGHEMKMIAHDVRYSDLRKFLYSPPQNFQFQGLQKVQRLPVPGLDEGDRLCPNFEFVHPVSALKNRHRDILDDISLEARDCLSLWKHMAELGLGRHLSPEVHLPERISKADIKKWEQRLKATLGEVMVATNSPFSNLQARLGSSTDKRGSPENVQIAGHLETLFPLACDLHAQDAMPAVVFQYDRLECERAVRDILEKLESAEENFKQSNAGWFKKLQDFEKWQKSKLRERDREVKVPKRAKGVKEAGQERTMTKLELAREEASKEVSPWESFDPRAPLEQFSFSDWTKLQKSEFDELVGTVRSDKVAPVLVRALERGLGVHHAGMNLKYRQIVEILFRKGYLRFVVATGTLALGINMPCKTVVFSGDSIYLTALTYRQASGRAGRRGFDLLGNVVFNGIPRNRVYEIMSSRLPDLRGQFPISTTLVLRLIGLLHGTENSTFAKNAVEALLSQTRLYLGGPDSEMSVKHHLRFSIEYLRRQNLLSADGTPLNFAGLVGHLYFTENSVFAFHSLLRGGYFHELCAYIDAAPDRVLLRLMLVLCHLFNRIPLRRTRRLSERIHRSSSVVFLPRLPQKAEEMLIQHNKQTLSIFKSYVQSYINQHLSDKPDRTLPFTKATVRDGSSSGDDRGIRSPFVSLSGFTDEFESIHELCSTVRGGVFLEESAIPFIPIWPHDTPVGFNAYIYDFFKHGSLETLVRDNRIKRGNVWFLLKDFSLTLKVIVSSLQAFIGGDGDLEIDDDEDTDEDSSGAEVETKKVTSEPESDSNMPEQMPIPKLKKKEKVADSWEDGLTESESESESGSEEESSLHGGGGARSLVNVAKAFAMLQEQFQATFEKVWA